MPVGRGIDVIVPAVDIIRPAFVDRLGGIDAIRVWAPVEVVVDLPDGSALLLPYAEAGPPDRVEELWERGVELSRYLGGRIGPLNSHTLYSSLPRFVNKGHAALYLVSEQNERDAEWGEGSDLRVHLRGGRTDPLDLRVDLMGDPPPIAMKELERRFEAWHAAAGKGIVGEGPVGAMGPLEWRGACLRTTVDWGTGEQDTLNALIAAVHDFDASIAPVASFCAGPPGGRLGEPGTRISQPTGTSITFEDEEPAGPRGEPLPVPGRHVRRSSPAPGGVPVGLASGKFYANVTLSGPHHSAVVEFLRTAGYVAYVAPTASGFTVVYEQGCDTQDDAALAEFGETLSGHFGCPALVALVHDDDVFAYLLYRNGERIDEYDSTPGYFDSNECLPPSGGRADVLCQALGSPAAAPEVERILRTPNGTDSPYLAETDRHMALVRALGLPISAVSLGYAYARGGGHPQGLSRADLIYVGPE
jgi:hypothetical protein